MHPWRLLVLAGLVVAGIGLFLTQATFPGTGPTDGFSGDSWPVMVGLIPAALLALLGRSRFPALLVLLLSAAALAFAGAKVVDARAAVSHLPGATLGVGVWTVIAGAALAVLGGLLALRPQRR